MLKHRGEIFYKYVPQEIKGDLVSCDLKDWRVRGKGNTPTGSNFHNLNVGTIEANLSEC